MKRAALILAFVLAALPLCARTVGYFGVIGGASFSRAAEDGVKAVQVPLYHAGITAKLNLGAGFAIQPSLLYEAKASKKELSGVEIQKTSIGYLELPVGLQWGPDLILLRPYLEVAPYLGLGVNSKSLSETAQAIQNAWNELNRFAYGLALGGGLDVWHLQISAHYAWNFNKTFKATDEKFGTVQISLAYFF